jgi:tetratricopeptide (TPR) repeat protein
MGLFPWRVSWMAAAVLLTAVACEDPEERERALFQSGVAYFEAGDHERAMVEFKNAAQINPTNADAYYYIARIHESERSWREAFSTYLRTVEQARDHVDANVRLGRMYLLAGDYDEALARAEVAVSVEAENAEALALRAAIYLRRGQLHQAQEEALRALDVDPANVFATSVLVAYHRAKGRHREAVAVLKRIIDLNPAETSLRLLKIALHIERQEHAAAVADLRTLVETDPANTGYRISLARAYVSWGRPDAAEAVLREAIAAKPDDDETKLLLVDFLEKLRSLGAAENELTSFIHDAPDSFALRFGLAGLYNRQDRRTAAMAVLRDIIERDETGSQSIRARVSLARLSFAEGDRLAAQGLIAEVLAVEPENPGALLLRALIAFEERRFLDTISDLRTILRGDPGSSRAMALLSQAYLRNGEHALAIDSLMRLVELDAKNDIVRLQLSQLLARRGDLEAALDLLDESLELFPQVVPLLTTKAEVLIEMRRFAEAETVAEEVKALPRSELVYWALLGKTAFADSRFEDAVAALEKARESNPKSSALLVTLVRSLLGLERYDGAAKTLEDYLAVQPEDGEAWLLLGDVYVLLKQFESAAGAYNRATEGARSIDTGYLKLSKLQIRQGSNDKSVQTLRRGVAALPKSERLVLALALNLQRLGRFEQAMAVYEGFLRIDPRSAVVANNLAALVADHRTDDTEALRRAISLMERLQTSGNPQFLDSIGWLHYRVGEVAQAIAFLKRAIDLAPESLELTYHIGVAFLAEEKYALAHKHLKKALPAGVNLPFTGEARKALSKIPDPQSGS